jgi:hypothetical protein
VPRAPSLLRDPRPSRITRKSYGPRVPNRTMVAKFDHVLLCWFRNGQASSPRRDENRWQGKPQPLRNHVAAIRAAGAAATSISAQSVGLESKKTSGRGEVFFLDFPLYRTSSGTNGMMPRPQFESVSTLYSMPSLLKFATNRTLLPSNRWLPCTISQTVASMGFFNTVGVVCEDSRGAKQEIAARAT